MISRINNRCLLLVLASLCSTIFLLLLINYSGKFQDTSSRGVLREWLDVAHRKVLAMSQIVKENSMRETIEKQPSGHVKTETSRQFETTPVTVKIKKPPLYPPGFRLSDIDNFTFAINNDVCGDAKVDVVMIVTSNSREPSHRAGIRAALPQATLDELRMRRVFLLAQLPPPQTKANYDLSVAAQQAENHEHGDLISGNFQDTYHNLTYKHLMGLHWASTYCPQATYILKMDHDVVVDVFRLREHLASAPRKMMAVGAIFIGTSPMRDKGNKWYVSKEEFPADIYPAYMSGWMYVITPDAATALVVAARKERFFWVDDAFVTGVVREKHVPDMQLFDMDQLWAQPDSTGKSAQLFTLEIDCIYECAAEAESSRSHCDTLVGPAWENDLVLRLFMKQAEFCWRHRCPRRTQMPDACHGTKKIQRNGMPQQMSDLGYDRNEYRIHFR